jgi:hypothetical protein
LEAYAKNSSDLALRKININTWKSAVSSQYSIRSIPHLVLCNPDGKVELRGYGEVLNFAEKKWKK